MADVDIAPVYILHRHGGKRQHAVDEILEHRGHTVAVERIAEQQKVAVRYLPENFAHVVVKDAMTAVVFAGEAAAAEFDVPVDHVYGVDFLRSGLAHAVQKRARDGACRSFPSLGCR